MSRPLTADQVRRIALLARISVDDDQVAALQHDLSAVLGYMDRLRELDLTGVDPLGSVNESPGVLGEDVPGPTLPIDALRAMAPDSYDRFVRIPKVIDEGGGA
ncbi:MAG: Glutamyl-tRNA(Gln) amidotransferase subunit C [Phycisphaerales bacterium]|nr:Glutamyl-tRNA(Gln) amidotransferase subunit C [Phycisphaerales bacterium]